MINNRNVNTFDESSVIFVNDYFTDEYVGGAELSTEALFNSSPYKTFKIKSSELNQETINKGVQKTWVFFNCAQMNPQLIPFIVGNCYYYVVEYDYKFCKYRSIEKHYAAEQKICDCHNQQHGKVISAFFSGAERIFWMSKKQKTTYEKRFTFLKESKSTILSSIFNVKDLEQIEKLRNIRKEQAIQKEYVVLDSTSWIKGAEQTRAYLNKQQIDFVMLGGLPYSDMLRTLSDYAGLAFMPLGGDTCPRIVIEARLLGLNLILNENVQHASEDWWSKNLDEIESYLLDGHNRFWDVIVNHVSRPVKLSGYTTTKDVIKSDYPWEESIKSLLSFCDEVVVLDGGSQDGTYEKLLEWSRKENKLIVKQFKRNWDNPNFAIYDGQQKAIARTLCTGDWCWQMDVDEIVHEDDYEKIKQLIRQVPKSTKLISLPVYEYWGGTEKVRVDINPWKWRLSRNEPYITHGINAQHIAYDENGDMYSKGSDGCDYIRSDNYESIGHVNFYTSELHQVRMLSLENNKEAIRSYENYMNLVSNQLPGVHHYSWFDIKRKIYTYKNYWSKHWASLYKKTIEDVPENNMFFDKPWSEVTDQEIKELSDKMKIELGGWIFHSRVDFTRPTPWINISRGHPEVIHGWIQKREEK